MLDSHGDLAIAEVAFFGPALLLGLVVNFKQGFSGNMCWIYICLVSILQIVGASCTIYLETNAFSSGLQTTAIITSAVGTAPLLLTLVGFLERINAKMTGSEGLSQVIFYAIHLVAIVALALAIVGGVKESGTDLSSRNTGKDFLEAGSVIFAAVYLAIGICTILSALKMSYIPEAERKLMIAGLCVLPFLLVKIVYGVALSFSNPGSIFYFFAPSVWVQAFMNFLPLAICVAIYLWAGFVTPKRAKTLNDGSVTRGGIEEEGHAPRQKTPTQRQKKSLNDYRPSVMIRNALRS